MSFLKKFSRSETADGYDPYKLASPQVFLLSMLIFLAIVAFIAVILTRQISSAFATNPGLNGLIAGVLLVGILLVFGQVARLFREVRWVNSFRAGSETNEPVLLAPMKALLAQVAAEGGDRRVHLFWGARYTRELYDMPALHKLAHGNERLQVVPCVSDDTAMGGMVESGTAVDVALRHGPWPEQEIYVCGSPSMVEGTLTKLEESGTSLSRVHIDELGHEETLP